MANAQASLATGKAVNTALLVSANDAAVPDKQSVEYFRASRDASIVTTPLLHGVKNEIVLASYGGNNTYSFITDFEGLTPTESMGDSITLLDAEGNAAAYMNVEEVRDAAGKVSLYNRIDIAPYGDGGQYIVTVTLDEAFLTAPDTVYPLRAATTSQATIGSAKINDADVNSGSPSTNYGSSSTLWVGYINGAKYRSYVQFIIGSYVNTILPDNITNAYLKLYELSGNTSTFSLLPRIPSNIWNYTSLTWNNQPGLLASFNSVSAPGKMTLTGTNKTYNLSLTAFVKACMRNYIDDSDNISHTINEMRGFAMRIENESSEQVRMFSSTNASANKPSLVVTYTPVSSRINCYNNGCATGYRYLAQGVKVNCWAYSLERGFSIEPYYNAGGAMTTSTQISNSEIINWIKSITSGYVVSERTIASPYSSVSSNEYRVCFRANTKPRKAEGGNAGEPSGGYYINEYHFIVQTSSGDWAHKDGANQTYMLGDIRPENNASFWAPAGNTATSTATITLAIDPVTR